MKNDTSSSLEPKPTGTSQTARNLGLDDPIPPAREKCETVRAEVKRLEAEITTLEQRLNDPDQSLELLKSLGIERATLLDLADRRRGHLADLEGDLEVLEAAAQNAQDALELEEATATAYAQMKAAHSVIDELAEKLEPLLEQYAQHAQAVQAAARRAAELGDPVKLEAFKPQSLAAGWAMFVLQNQQLLGLAAQGLGEAAQRARILNKLPTEIDGVGVDWRYQKQ